MGGNVFVILHYHLNKRKTPSVLNHIPLTPNEQVDFIIVCACYCSLSFYMNCIHICVVRYCMCCTEEERKEKNSLTLLISTLNDYSKILTSSVFGGIIVLK